ncbi:MAG: 23S rRNA (pseudouridine(1915)-N(3))-methyltransferase RlmH [Gemmatimonadetes bacterium]|nr:23S rRNA (pseudouridine(1915)-N(3))-methyltransferase RlmH [Gemmatimonadota bacterium]
MKWTLVAVGKLRPALREVCDDYLRRLGRHLPVEEREVREAGRAGSPTRQREEEGKRLLEALPSSTDVVLLDVGGSEWSSESLASQLEGWRLAARDRAFVIGGAEGVSDAVRTRASARWSLGPLTLPHELARVVVVEQLYRAGTILRGEPYHRGERDT